jgi:hypothetical protein
VAGALLVLFAAAATVFAFREGIWYDEACSLTTARGTLGDTLEHANRMERQPPLYFLVLNLWLRLHRSIGFARLLSAAAALAGLVLTARTFVRVSREETPSAFPLILGVLMAFPVTMYLATEARGYAFQYAMGSLLASTLAAAHARGSATRADVAIILAAGVLLSYVNYLAGMAAACVTLAMLASRTLTLRQAAIIAAGGVVLTIPLLLTVRSHVQTHVEPHGQGLSLEGGLMVLQNLARLAIPHAVARGAWQSLLGVGLAAAVVAALFLRRRAGGASLPPKSFLVAAGFTVALFLAVGFLTGPALVYERYFSAFLPVLLITSFLLLRASFGWTATIALLLTLGAGGLYRIVALHGPGVRMGDWRRLAARIDQAPPPPLPVYVFPPPESLTLRAEIGDPRRVEAFPKDFDGSRASELSDYSVEDPERLRARVARRVGSGQFWFAYTLQPIAPVELQDPLEIVRTFVDRRCVVDGDFPFSGSRLLLLRLRD